MTHPTRLLCALTVTAGLLLPAQAGAIVPPKNCGTIKVGSKRYQVKADQITCRTAKRYATTLIRSRKRPSGYRCVKGSRGSKLLYQCVNTKASPDRTLWIFRR